MSDRDPGSRLLWRAAVVVVPLALGGIALIWPGARITEDVRQRAVEALAGASLGDVSVQVSGRDVTLAAVPAGAERAALATVARVDGVVAEALRAGGVDPARITARGLGDSRPLATEAASRRVEISLEEG
ncbi:hypothetical protein [Pseudonocardia acidicola]|uniref:OmpA family protein n=1 Tax=Pseudonocardia acidicola TaxID=2724939 RepID=A0ABX1SDW4_9PSEU|nr:hypothetical protein [Pseudonocardia acidicola]NMH99756.1 hypothetical protein [Pseudonocardia acidicola]